MKTALEGFVMKDEERMRRISKVATVVLVFIFSISFSTITNAEEAICLQAKFEDKMLTSIQNSFQVSNFELFFDLVDPYQSDSESTRYENIRKFEKTFPNGFDSCTSLLTDRLGLRLMQNITAYKTHDGEYIFLLIVFMKFNEEFEVVKYHISSTFDAVFEQLR